jgi:hypothetical protein
VPACGLGAALSLPLLPSALPHSHALPCPALAHTPLTPTPIPKPTGQAAADKIFESKQKKPLDKAKTAKGKAPVKKAPVKGKTTRR